MKPHLYSRVALARDLKEHGLKKGDVGVLVDYVPHPHGGEEGAVLEIFNAVGESLTEVTVGVSGIEPVRADEILAVRSLAKAG